MANEEITVGWEKLANVIIESLSEAALNALNAQIKDGAKEGLIGIANGAAGGILQGVSWGGLAPAAIIFILGQLLTVQQQQTKLLKSIQRDVKAVVEGPYYAGMTHLEDALREHRTLEQRLSFITKARNRFVDALGNQQQNPDPIYRAIIEREIGICWLLSGSLIDAKVHLERSLASANQALSDAENSHYNRETAIEGSALGGSMVAGVVGAATFGIGLVVGFPALFIARKGAKNKNDAVYDQRRVLIQSFISSVSRILHHLN
jgi:hypothetical protein